MFELSQSRKRHLFRATKVRRRLVFPSDEGQANSTVDTTTSNSSSSGVSGSVDEEELEDFFLEEAFDSVHLGDLNKTPVAQDQPSAVKEPPTKRRCRETQERTEWRTREGKLLSKILPTSERAYVVRLDELKHVLKTATDPRLIGKVSEVYDMMKLKMAGKLINLYKTIERDIENLDKTMSPRSLLLEMRKKDAIKAILGVWGVDRRQHTDDMRTPPRVKRKMPLQEIQVLPDGSLVRPNDSGYHDNSLRAQDVRTCVEGCLCSSQEQPHDDKQTDGQRHRSESSGNILNVTQQEDGNKGVQRRSSGSSDGSGSYCDCNFCLQNGAEQQQDPLRKFRAMQQEAALNHQKTQQSKTIHIHQVQQLLDPEFPTTVPQLSEESYSSQLTRFRDTHQENSLNSNDSTTSSMVSFNCQDDILASSPLSRDVTSDDVTSSSRSGVTHDDTAQMLGSLMLLPRDTPSVLGAPHQGMTDSMVVLGSNSHVTRLSDSEDDT